MRPTSGSRPDGEQASVIRCLEATTPGQFDRVRILWTEFRAWLETRYTGPDAWLLDSYFDGAGWEAELAELPGEYGSDLGGALVLATDGNSALGVVALRALDGATCEMKRMFVTATARGRGVAHHLVDGIVERARSLGYTRMVLDTGFRQHEAEGLYRSHGFETSEPPYPVDERLAAEGLTFLARAL
jgi:GNAT superfamily N-acetyltransferase